MGTGLSRDVPLGSSQGFGWATQGHSEVSLIHACVLTVLRAIVLSQSEVSLDPLDQVLKKDISVLRSIQLSLKPDQSPEQSLPLTNTPTA